MNDISKEWFPDEAAILERVAFFKDPHRHGPQHYARWLVETRKTHSESVSLSIINGDIRNAGPWLRPLAAIVPNRFLFFGCRNDWILFCDNRRRGTDSSAAPVLASLYDSCGVEVVAHEANDKSTGAYMVAVHERDGSLQRWSAFVASGKSWKRKQFGCPFQFDRQLASAQTRLTKAIRRSLVASCLLELDIDFQNPNFFCGNSALPDAWLVEIREAAVTMH